MNRPKRNSWSISVMKPVIKIKFVDTAVSLIEDIELASLKTGTSRRSRTGPRSKSVSGQESESVTSSSTVESVAGQRSRSKMISKFVARSPDKSAIGAKLMASARSKSAALARYK
jgi:hypothetical protein